jgi:hypothetical protein
MVGTSMRFEVRIVEALAPQTTQPNPTEVAVVAYEHLFHLLLGGHFLPAAQWKTQGLLLG